MRGAVGDTRVRQNERSLWMYVPVVLLFAMLAGLGTLAAIAIDDPSFAVEKDYYQKAVLWDREAEQQQQNARLGWQTELALVAGADGRTEIEVVLRDGARAPIADAKVSLEGFPNAHAGERLTLELDPVGTGRYRAQFSPRRGGLWEFRLRAVRGSESYTEIERQDLAARSAQ